MRMDAQTVDSFSCHKTTLGSLLRAPENYVIPAFQRYYAWDIGNFADFWADIYQTFTEHSTEHLLGSVVFNNEENTQLVVIDGQQRLTTASILLCALRNILIEKGEQQLANEIEDQFLFNMMGAPQYTPKLSLNGYDKDFYENHILKKHSPEDAKRIAKSVGLPTSNKYLAACYNYMHNKIDEMCNADWNIKDLTSCILSSYSEKLILIRIDVGNDQDAFRLFETLNERGRDLSKFDLLKNYMFSVSKAKLRAVQSNWEIISQNLGYQRTVKFIRHHWMSSQGDVREKELFSKVQAHVTSPEMVEEYTSSLIQPSALYGSFFAHDHHIWDKFAKDKKYHLRNLLHATKIMQAEQLFVVLLATLEVSPKNCLEMLKMLTIFTFRYSTICGLPSANLTPVYIKAAQKIRQNPEISVQAIFQEFFLEIYPDDDEFYKHFSTKATRDKALSRYILTEINNSLDGRPSMETQTNTSVTDLEHVLPHKYEEFWNINAKDFPDGVEKYVHYLGNMTLLSAKLNQDIGNADFETKKKAYIEDDIAITEMIIKADVWTAKEICERQLSMAEIAKKIWKYDTD